jgi:hypothetical protein
MSKRDAKIELIRTQIAREIETIQAGTYRPGLPAPTPSTKPSYLAGLRRAVDLLDRVVEEVA